MLSFEKSPPCSSEIESSERGGEGVHHPKDEATESETPTFCIRSYVQSSRGGDIGNHWPFSQQFFRLCLKHGVRNLLPPFEPPDAVKARCSRTWIEPQPETVRVPPDDDLPVLAADRKSPPPRKCDLKMRLSDNDEVDSVKDGSASTIMASDSMASKVCPVCKTFSSTSNTTLNAHIDQCLLSVGGIAAPLAAGEICRLKVKPKKKRSMAEILACAPCSSLEDLDRRNGTSWAVDLSMIRFSGEVPPRDGPVYLDSKLPGAAAEAAALHPPPDFVPQKRFKHYLEVNNSSSPGSSTTDRRTLRRKKIRSKKTRSSSWKNQAKAMAEVELNEEIPSTAPEEPVLPNRGSSLLRRSSCRLLRGRSQPDKTSPITTAFSSDDEVPSAGSPAEEQTAAGSAVNHCSTTRKLRLRIFRPSEEISVPSPSPEATADAAATPRRRRSAASSSVNSSKRGFSDGETPSTRSVLLDGEQEEHDECAAADDGNGGADGALVEVSSAIRPSSSEEGDEAAAAAGFLDISGDKMEYLPEAVKTQIDYPCLVSTEVNVLELQPDHSPEVVEGPSPSLSTLPAGGVERSWYDCSGDRGGFDLQEESQVIGRKETQFPTNRSVAAAEPPPSSSLPNPGKKNPVLRLMGKNLMVISQTAEEEADEQGAVKEPEMERPASTMNNSQTELGFSPASRFSNAGDFPGRWKLYSGGDGFPASRRPFAPPPTAVCFPNVGEFHSLRHMHGPISCYRAPVPEMRISGSFPPAPVVSPAGNFFSGVDREACSCVLPSPEQFPLRPEFTRRVDASTYRLYPSSFVAPPAMQYSPMFW